MVFFIGAVVIGSDEIREIVEEVLFGPTIEDIQHMIEPDASLRLLKQLCCEHTRWDWSRCMCLDCGVTFDAIKRVA